jgi:hypothetical protein
MQQLRSCAYYQIWGVILPVSGRNQLASFKKSPSW